MNEAEALGERIGILINGRFACLNTLHTLKSRYSSGNTITIEAPNSDEVSL